MENLKKFILKNFKNYQLKLIEIDEAKIKDIKINKKIAYFGIKEFKNKLPRIKEIDNFIFVVRVLDFRLWEYPHNWFYRNEKGFFGLLERVKDLFNYNLNKVNFKDFRKIISPKENQSLALLRYKLFKQSINWLNKNYQQNFANYFEENKNPYNFCLNLMRLKKFQDYWQNFYFLKPNQLLYYEYILAKNLEKRFTDELEQLTIFADYKIPQVLINSGIINLEKNSLIKIQNNNIIKRGSKLENELRISSIIAGEIISKNLKIPVYLVDNILWYLSHKINLKIPYPKIKTIFY
jgi:hypothetical protein